MSVLFGQRFCVFRVVVLWMCHPFIISFIPCGLSEYEELEEKPQGIERKLEKVKRLPYSISQPWLHLSHLGNFENSQTVPTIN